MYHENIFKNLREKEFDLAIRWYDNLRGEERPRICETLRIIGNYDFKFTNNISGVSDKVAVLVAGSSIHEGKYNYDNINLFLVSKDNHWKRGRSFRIKNFKGLNDELTRSELVEYSFGYNTSTEKYFDDKGSQWDYKDFDDRDRDLSKVGALIGARSFQFCNKYFERRKCQEEDILNLVGNTSSEAIIKYNRKEKSKFLVLLRQYEVE